MRMLHTVLRAPKAPQPGKIYGARIGGMRLNKDGVTVVWEIFASKNRAVKGAKK